MLFPCGAIFGFISMFCCDINVVAEDHKKIVQLQDTTAEDLSRLTMIPH